MDPLSCISPVDGRYHKITAPLSAFFSEEALIRYRILSEIEYFIALCQLPLPALSGPDGPGHEKMRDLYRKFTRSDARQIKAIEQTTRHDIKAVEYFIKEAFEKIGYGKYKEYVHFGLTSQDINNTAIPLSLKEAMSGVMQPAFEQLMDALRTLANDWLEIPMLARTHGQPASPTTVGKEIMVFHNRLSIQLRQLSSLPYPAKFGGATGNFNAHRVTFPDIDWSGFANRFVASLGLERSQVTTQIDHYDQLAAIFDCLRRIATILIDLVRDCWTYISLDYFKQKIVAGEVGSSAMPHKVNPIDFENAEGNAGLAIALLGHLSEKLPISRLQRDLSDSTVLRNIGLPLAHLLIALKATSRGLGKLSLNRENIDSDLEGNMVVVAEAIQSILRSLDYPEPYEALKKLTRQRKAVTKEELQRFIDGLTIAPGQKERLKQITPFNYTGIIPPRID